MKNKILIAMTGLCVLMVSACGNSNKSDVSTESSTEEAQIEESVDEVESSNSDESNVEDFDYVVLEDGTIGISAYNGSAPVVRIPDEIDGNTVTSVDGISSNDIVTKVIIPDSVATIEDGAFYSDTNLEEVVLGTGVKIISEDAFDQDTSLRKINIPDTVTEIGANAFCLTALTEVEIPSNITVLNPYTYSLTPVEKATIPGNVSMIDQGVFEGCTELKEVVIEEGVETIGSGVFDDAESLTRVEIPASVTSIDSYLSDSCTIVAPSGSYAETYANENGYAFEAK